MTPTAWGQGATNALICGLGILVFCCVMAAPVSLISGQPFFDSFGLALKVFWAFTLLGFLGTWLHDRADAGRVLLDCGPPPMRNLHFFNAGLLLILAWMEGVASAPLSSAFAISGPMFELSFAGFCLILATGRVQVRENGIWWNSSLLRWAKISSYHWADDSTLVVRQRGPLAFFKGALPFPPEHRQAIEKFMAERCRAARSN